MSKISSHRTVEFECKYVHCSCTFFFFFLNWKSSSNFQLAFYGGGYPSTRNKKFPFPTSYQCIPLQTYARNMANLDKTFLAYREARNVLRQGLSTLAPTLGKPFSFDCNDK